MTKIAMLCTTIFLIVLALTPLNDAANNWTEMLCQLAHPELKECNLECPSGNAVKDGCPICLCRSSLCEQKPCYFGQVCTIQQQVGQYEGQYTEVAVCVTDNRMLPSATEPPTEAPVTQFMGSCDFQGRCDSNGKCASEDSICRKDGWCCKVKQLTGYTLDRASTDMAKCMEVPEVGPCRALGTQYVYNKDTGKCESMIYGGCVTSRNSFASIELCQQTCEHPCQKPKTEARCRASLPRYYFNEEKEACETFDLGGCAGTANYFMTPWDCETHCKGLRKTSIKPERGIEEGQAATQPTTPPTYTTPGFQSDRDNLKQQIINSFRRRNPEIQNRGEPTFDGEENKVNYRQRPQPGGGVFRVDENGNLMYVRNTNRPPTNPTIPTYRTDRGDGFTHLGDRVRSAQQLFTNFRRGQVNYTNPRLRFTGRAYPVYRDRRFRPYTPASSYQRSVEALRRHYNS